MPCGAEDWGGFGPPSSSLAPSVGGWPLPSTVHTSITYPHWPFYNHGRIKRGTFIRASPIRAVLRHLNLSTPSKTIWLSKEKTGFLFMLPMWHDFSGGMMAAPVTAL